MRKLTLAATQFACGGDSGRNLDKAEALVRRAAAEGAPGRPAAGAVRDALFLQGPAGGRSSPWPAPLPAIRSSPALRRWPASWAIVLPVSFFERANNAHYNSVMVIDADGSELGIYRKSHIPDGVGYQEKFYFNPGDTGFRVWSTAHGRIGVGICWDQWFPECARSMALQGAEVLLYPTAIGSEPLDPALDSRDHWRRVMQGHAGANLMPLVASNRIGHEQGETSAITFYGQSFIAGPTGEILASADEERGRAGRELRPRCHRDAARRLGPLPRPPARALRRSRFRPMASQARVDKPRVDKPSGADLD